jgi:hypothetical protein
MSEKVLTSQIDPARVSIGVSTRDESGPSGAAVEGYALHLRTSLFGHACAELGPCEPRESVGYAPCPPVSLQWRTSSCMNAQRADVSYH